jgi:hypothetical protein
MDHLRQFGEKWELMYKINVKARKLIDEIVQEKTNNE